ncbi:all trans-polyprenyl-diphosphate synthase PDSS1-like isoform X2 [Ptychodera flava]|uniref:all trans-polyprenyl-diphosphate synthase PDSS1-like isoform X2 n=1 Tax=Ptychodera flava TaxID=63121 RepID=UPI003969E7AA
MAANQLPNRCRLLISNLSLRYTSECCSPIRISKFTCCLWKRSLHVNRANCSSVKGPLLQCIRRHSIKDRYFCTSSSPSRQESSNPEKLTETELSHLCDDIKKELNSSKSNLGEISHYLFDGKGKAFRPMTVLLTAKACNYHCGRGSEVLSPQYRIAMISEMLHTASLIHDDVIDAADTRRGKPSVNNIWGQTKSIFAGDYVISTASMMLAKLGNEDVVILLSQVIDDLVRGEFMQLGSKEDENERFAHYLEKTYKKTASLLANSCKAVALLGDCGPSVTERAFQYGRNVGIAFQLIDDMLDYISSDKLMGKPTSTDLKLGLATAPVLFACHTYPELNSLIMRRFSEPGDVEKARQLVAKTDGIEQTKYLAQQYCQEAIRQINGLEESPARNALVTLTHKVLNRLK